MRLSAASFFFMFLSVLLNVLYKSGPAQLNPLQTSQKSVVVWEAVLVSVVYFLWNGAFSKVTLSRALLQQQQQTIAAARFC